MKVRTRNAVQHNAFNMALVGVLVIAVILVIILAIVLLDAERTIHNSRQQVLAAAHEAQSATEQLAVACSPVTEFSYTCQMAILAAQNALMVLELTAKTEQIIVMLQYGVWHKRQQAIYNRYQAVVRNASTRLEQTIRKIRNPKTPSPPSRHFFPTPQPPLTVSFYSST